jgi:chaperonin GroES
MKIRPLQDRIIVRRLEADSVSAGGIIIPENAKEKPIQGEVLAVGNGRLLENGDCAPMGCAAGDTILFGKYAGTDVTLDGEDYLIIKADDVLGVVERFHELVVGHVASEVCPREIFSFAAVRIVESKGFLAALGRVEASLLELVQVLVGHWAFTATPSGL